MFGDEPYASAPYGAIIVALDVRGLVGLSIQGLFSVVLVSALAPTGQCAVSHVGLFSVALTDSVTE